MHFVADLQAKVFESQAVLKDTLKVRGESGLWNISASEAGIVSQDIDKPLRHRDTCTSRLQDTSSAAFIEWTNQFQMLIKTLRKALPIWLRADGSHRNMCSCNS